MRTPPGRIRSQEEEAGCSKEAEGEEVALSGACTPASHQVTSECQGNKRTAPAQFKGLADEEGGMLHVVVGEVNLPQTHLFDSPKNSKWAYWLRSLCQSFEDNGIHQQPKSKSTSGPLHIPPQAAVRAVWRGPRWCLCFARSRSRLVVHKRLCPQPRNPSPESTQARATRTRRATTAESPI